jgi:F0F1-type ATP synthase assembly protein I
MWGTTSLPEMRHGVHVKRNAAFWKVATSLVSGVVVGIVVFGVSALVFVIVLGYLKHRFWL